MSRIEEIDPVTVLRARGTMKLVDVREPEELLDELGKLEDAISIPLAILATAAAGWNKNAPIVLICRSGKRSARAAEMLIALGFTRVHNMTGGMMALRRR